MRIYRSVEEIEYNANRIITVGSFDGVHRGHKEIIRRLTSQAQEEKLSSMLVTFEPHPQLVINNPNKPQIKILTDVDEKIEILSTLNIDELLIVNFTDEFSQTSPEEYVRDFIFGKIGVKKVIMGYDHLFGKARSGDFNLLMNLAIDLNFKLERVPALEGDNIIISSSNIREMISSNRLEEANYMLGYTYFVVGTVVEGNKLGRTIGFPTANIQLNNPNKLLPKNGVYLVNVLIGTEKFWGMANIGKRPTVSNDNKEILEVNIFDLNRDIYGEEIKISFYRFIRNEQKFPDVSSLKAQLERDRINCHNLEKMFY